MTAYNGLTREQAIYWTGVLAGISAGQVFETADPDVLSRLADGGWARTLPDLVSDSDSPEGDEEAEDD